MSETKMKGNGMTAFEFLQISLVLMKLSGVTALSMVSWWIIFSPALIVLAVYLLIVAMNSYALSRAAKAIRKLDEFE